MLKNWDGSSHWESEVPTKGLVFSKMLANHLFFHQSLLPCRHLDEQRELPFNLAAIGSRSAVSSGLKIATKRSLNKHHPFWGVIIVTHKRSGWTSENHPGKDHIRKPYWCLQSKGPYQSFDDGELFQEIFMPVSTHSVSVGHRELQPRHMHGNRWQFLLLQGPLADHLNKGSKIRDLATQGPTFLDFFLAFYLAKSLHPYPPVHQCTRHSRAPAVRMQEIAEVLWTALSAELRIHLLVLPPKPP